MGQDPKQCKELEVALGQPEEMLRLVLKAIPVAVHWKDLNSVYLGCNNRFAQDAELDCPEQIVGKTDFDLPWRQYAEFYQSRDRQVIATGEPLLGYEQPRVSSEGRTYWLRQNKLPLRDTRGRIIGVLSTYEDITAYKQALLALQQSEARYRAVVEHSPEGIAVSIGGKVVFANPAATHLVARGQADQLLGRPVSDFVSAEFMPLYLKRRQEVLDQRAPVPLVEGQLRRIDGTAFEAESLAVPIVYNEQPAALLCFRDITARKRAEEALRESERRYRTLFECAQDAIFMDEGEHFADCNRQTLQMFQCTREQIIGRSPAFFSPPRQPDGRDSGEKAREKMAAAYAGQPQFFEWRHRRCDGTEFDTEVSLNRIEVGERPMLLAIVRDITERKRAEAVLARHRDELEVRVRERTAELEQANQRLREVDRLKSQFLTMMSHELRTPLNSIIGFTGLLRRACAGPVTAEQLKQLGLVDRAARHLLSLINDLLDLSRIEAGKAEVEHKPFSFNTAVTEVLETLSPAAHQKGLELAADLPLRPIEMVGDRRKCCQVLLNLINNAIKFTERGQVSVEARAEGDRVRVCVADTGIGIRPEQMGLLFEPFRQLDDSVRRSYEGTGLGLNLSKRLLGLMGGEIHVESEFGHGSRFCFTLPRRPAPAKGELHEDTQRG